MKVGRLADLITDRDLALTLASQSSAATLTVGRAMTGVFDACANTRRAPWHGRPSSRRTILKRESALLQRSKRATLVVGNGAPDLNLIAEYFPLPQAALDSPRP